MEFLRFYFPLVVRTFPCVRAGEGTDDAGNDDGGKDGDGQDPKDGDGQDPKNGKDGDGNGKQTFSREEVEALRKEAARYRTTNKKNSDDLKAAQLKLKEIEDKDKTDLQKAQEKIAELEGAVRTLSSKSSLSDFSSTASRLNAIDPDVVARLVDPDSELSPEQQIKALIKSKPYLFKPSSNGSGDGGKGGERGREKGGGASMNDLIREEERESSGKLKCDGSN